MTIRCSHRTGCRYGHSGFSLLELAVVVAIISLIAGAGMSVARNALQAADRISTQEKLNTIKLALDGHAKTYGYLPCPANLTLLPSSSTFGMESRVGPPGTSCALSPPGVVGAATNSVIIGTVPVRTLGLPDSYTADAWGNKLTYAVGAAMVADSTSYATQAGAITVRYGNRTTYYTVTQKRNSYSYDSVTDNSGAVRLNGSLPSTDVPLGATVYISGSSSYRGTYTVTSKAANSVDLGGLPYSMNAAGTIQWQADGASAAYIVLSHGPDGRGSFPMLGTSVPATKLCTGVGVDSSPPPCSSSATTSCIDIENCNNSDEIFYDTAFDDGDNAAQHFDDFVVWGSNEQQRLPINDKLYTACVTTTPATCETWCATCNLNYPGGSTSSPPAGLTNPVLCRKVIGSAAASCKASCFWSGTTASGYIKCP